MFKNLIIASFLGLLAVILGAFGAHSLKEVLTIDGMASFQTAVRYQLFHVLVILVINGFDFLTEKQKNSISYLFIAGILFFSGSIYLIQLTSITGKSIWFVTPLGGLFFVVGWMFLFVIFLKKSRKKDLKL